MIVYQWCFCATIVNLVAGREAVASLRRRDWSAELFADSGDQPASATASITPTQSRPTTHTTTMSAPARPLAALKSALRQLRADKHHSRCYATAAPAAMPGRPVNFHPGAIMTGRSMIYLLHLPPPLQLLTYPPQTTNTA